jgi:mono/diheme cytochrome c family protein
MMLSFDMGSSTHDVWNWSLALSEPLGYAIDMVKNNTGTNVDAGNKSYVRNNAGVDDRSGPQYQWDGVQQQLTRTPGGLTIVDPGYYLLTKMNFVGDALAGDAVFQGNCARCHGVNADGNGVDEQAAALNRPGFMNRYTKSSFVAFASSGSHDGATDFSTLTDKQVDDVFARLRGYSGIPGYYLQNPNGSSSDVHALSNVPLAKIDGNNSKGYSVLLIRSLNTGNTDDIIFTPSIGQYQFNINLSDNDDLNSIGLQNQTLTFKPK